jgi:hypothetical protein
MKMSGIGMKPDTVSAYYFHHRFPVTKEDANKLSLKYFNTLDGIINLGRYDDNKDPYWQFDINPFMATDKTTLDKIISSILDFSKSKRHFSLQIIWDGWVGGEDEYFQALYYEMLEDIKKGIMNKRRSSEINIKVDRGGSHIYISSICIPSLRVTFK